MGIVKNLYGRVCLLKLKLYRSIMVYLFNSIKGCKIAKGVVINKDSSFTGVEIGYGTYLSTNSKILNTAIGKFCSIGPNLVCGFGIHPTNGISTSPSFYSTTSHNGITFSSTDKIIENKKITIGSDVFIGANVTIIDGVTIGDGAVVGAGAVVSKDIPPYAIAVGCPIMIKKYRFSPAEIEKLLELKWWDKDEVVLRKVDQYFYNINDFFDNLKN